MNINLPINEKNKLNIEKESPLVILKHNRTFMFCLLCGVIYFIVSSTLDVILPVLLTGDYTEIHLTKTTYTEKVLWFYLVLVALPSVLYILLIFFLRAGAYYFYDDRLEFQPFWIKRKIIISYNQMKVFKLKTKIFILTQAPPSWLHPLQRFKILFWDGIAFGTIFVDPKVAGIKMGMTHTWENLADGPKALQVLKERALSWVEVDKI